MIRVLLIGCGGRMGLAVTAVADAAEDIEIVAGVDQNVPDRSSYPVYRELDLVAEQADVAVDFSHASLAGKLLDYCLAKKLPAVIATTGLDEEAETKIRDASAIIPIFRSANMSLSVNLMKDLIRKCVRVLGDGFDIEIVEKHHNQKLDAPSGTALMLADAAASERARKTEYVYDRHLARRIRDKNEIGIHAVRGGTIVGEHEVIFAGYNETLTISQSATSRDVFASGAVSAARFLTGKAPGLYSMDNLLKEMD